MTFVILFLPPPSQTMDRNITQMVTTSCSTSNSAPPHTASEMHVFVIINFRAGASGQRR